MNLDNYLQELNEQEVQEDKKIKVVRSFVVEKICKRYEQWLNGHKEYVVAKNLVEKLNYSAKDVKDFSIRIKKCESDKWFFCSGIFLSALVNASQESDFEILTEHLIKNLCYLGLYNKKNILVRGNVGSSSGSNMTAGSLIIMGDAELITGNNLFGGEIIIYG